MKKILSGIVLVCLLFSCSKDLESLNENTKDATRAAGETFFASAQINLTNRMYNVGLSQPPFVYFAQFFTEVTYVELSNYYIANTNVSDLFWSDMYQRVLKNLDESKKMIEEDEVVGSAEEIRKKNQLAIIEIMNAYVYGILVDTYGNVPYSESMNIDNVLPAYDDAFTIYKSIIARLNSAIGQLDISGAGFGKSDVIYNGNVTKWKKFAHSLLLKLGLRIIDIDPDLGKQTVLAAAGEVFESNEDNAALKYQPTTPNTNPLWTHLVQNNLRYFVATEKIANVMNDLNDPRREAYFSQVNGSYKGGKYGLVQSYDLSSHLSERYYEPTLEAVWTDYASVEFLLAEAVERGLLTNIGTAESHYNKAIAASFGYHQVGGLDAYLSHPKVSYQSAGSTWKEKIGQQKWLALFNQGFEAWTEYRRLDFPKLNAPENALIDEVPSRLFYPVSEQGLNGDNYQKAAAEIGGDFLETKIFWDIN